MCVVTIITPSYNSKSYFLDTFNSVIKQTFKDYEWLIIDDCSTDGTYDFVNDLIKDYPHIKLFKTKKNGGTSKARNIGLKHAKGKYVTFLDADDMLDENYLEEQVKFISQNGPIITAGYRRLASKTTTDFVPHSSIAYKRLLKGNDISCLTTMFDKSVIRDHYFPENFTRQEDFVFWLNILKEGYVVKTNNQILATYRIVESSKNRNKFKLIKPMFDVYHKSQHFNFFKSWILVINWIIYGLKKYKNVK